eukprot:SAG31_NODE_15728_length_741_cov_0.967290_2_plen_161_part_01
MNRGVDCHAGAISSFPCAAAQKKTLSPAHNGLDTTPQLGWRKAPAERSGLPFGKPQDSGVIALRHKLQAKNGIKVCRPGDLGCSSMRSRLPPVHTCSCAYVKGLEIIDPSSEGYAKRAAALFLRDGFVAVKNALTGERLSRMQVVSDRVVREMMALDPKRI